MTKFAVVKDPAINPRPYYIVDDQELPLLKRGTGKLRRFRTRQAAQKVADVLADAVSR